MHKYLIELMRYTEAGVPTNDYSADYADTPQQLADKVSTWNRKRYVNEDGTDGLKMYRVTVKQAAYQEIADFDTFCVVNGVEYHK